jgi:hypothetical protein
MKGLIIRKPWIEYILDGLKIWEIRNSMCHIRGTVGLIQSGSGLVVGKASIVDSFAITKVEFEMNRHLHCVPEEIEVTYKKMHAWVLADAVRFEKPIPYRHLHGTVIWANLNGVIFV